MLVECPLAALFQEKFDAMQNEQVGQKLTVRCANCTGYIRFEKTESEVSFDLNYRCPIVVEGIEEDLYKQ